VRPPVLQRSDVNVGKNYLSYWVDDQGGLPLRQLGAGRCSDRDRLTLSMDDQSDARPMLPL